MKVAVIEAANAHWTEAARRIVAGIETAGDEAVRAPYHTRQLLGVNAFVCWGWRIGARLHKYNPRVPVLVMERGYVDDRFHWTSLGWNGLNGRAVFPKAPELTYKGARIVFDSDRRLPVQTAPWSAREDYNHNPHLLPGYALILGQVQSDQACIGVNLAYQYRAWHDFLARAGWTVKYRPHPKAQTQASGLSRASYTRGTLAEDLAGAAFTVSWNSNSSVDSVLAGVPSVTFDEGAMAWPVTSHSLDNPVTMPDRTEWAAQLAWCQWQPSELADGTAWRAVKGVMP